jgi:hypothetical protein
MIIFDWEMAIIKKLKDAQKLSRLENHMKESMESSLK